MSLTKSINPSAPRGLSLIELLIAMSMGLVIGIVLTSLIVNTSRSYRFAQLQSQTATQISTYLERMSRVLRGSTDVVSASSTSLTVYAYFSPRDNVPDKVRYFVDTDNALKVGVIKATGSAPNYTYNSSDETVQTLLSDLRHGSTPVFTYYDDNNNQLTGTITPATVKEIGIRLELNPDQSILKQNVTGQTRINLRNRKTNL